MTGRLFSVPNFNDFRFRTKQQAFKTSIRMPRYFAFGQKSLWGVSLKVPEQTSTDFWVDAGGLDDAEIIPNAN